jgi:hypothetical protein
MRFGRTALCGDWPMLGARSVIGRSTVLQPIRLRRPLAKVIILVQSGTDLVLVWSDLIWSGLVLVWYWYRFPPPTLYQTARFYAVWRRAERKP